VWADEPDFSLGVTLHRPAQLVHPAVVRHAEGDEVREFRTTAFFDGQHVVDVGFWSSTVPPGVSKDKVISALQANRRATSAEIGPTHSMAASPYRSP
jgi:hypothetical protein